MQITEHLGLSKPNQNETFDIDVQNSNMDIIDEFAIITKADLEKLLARYNSEADYVVEQKTSGIWTYRKWNSGLAECWGRYTETITHYAGPYGTNFYGYHTSPIAFPIGLFIETPHSITYNGDIGSTFTIPAQGQLSMTKDEISCYFLITGSGSKTCAVELNVKGRWK